MLRLLIAFVAIFFVMPVSAQVDFRKETIYFLMPSRFYDGDSTNNRPTEWCSYYPGNPNNANFSGPQDVTWRGDFKGIIQKLDYLKDLGFTAIWMTPIQQNRGPLDYHGYHIWDFTKEDPRLTSPGYTFKNLIDSAHAKGIKIIMDVELNHAGRYGIKGKAEIKYNTDTTQAWGKDKFGKALADNPAWEYDGVTPNPLDDKLWSRSNLVKMPAPYNNNLAAYNWPGMESYVTTSDGNWFHKDGNGFAQGYDDTTNLYWRALAGDCPDFTTEGDSIRKYLIDAYKKFIDMGIDGMRLDAVKHMPKRDVQWFVNEFKKINPNLFVFAEVAQKRHELHPIEEINPHWYTWTGATGASANSGVAVLDFYAMGTFHLFNVGGGMSGVKAAERYDYLYSDPSTNLTFLDNHDFGPNNDWNQRFGGSPENLAACMNFMFLWRGIPVVYYGTEMQFKKGAYCDIQSGNDINKTLDWTGRAYYGNDIGNAPAHIIYKHIRKLNAIRKAVPALQNGSWRWDGTNDGNGVGFVRKAGSSEAAVGLAKDGAVTFNFSGLTNGTYKDAVTGNSINVTNGTLSFTVSPSSAGVYVLNGPGLIGDLGAGYFQSNSTGGGGTGGGGTGSGPITFTPNPCFAGQPISVNYSGSLRSQSQVNLYWSYDNWKVAATTTAMSKLNDTTWTASVTVPSAAGTNFSCVFNNGAGTWDNNNTLDYKIPVQSNVTYTNVTFNPNPAIAGQSLTIDYTGTLNTKPQVNLYWSYDNWSSSGITTTAMTKKDATTWTVTVTVPSAAATNFTCVFNDGAGTWDNNSTNDYKIPVLKTTPVNELNIPGLKVYPNPVKDMLYINLGTTNLSSPMQICLYNQTGQLLWQANQRNNQLQVNTKSLSPGIYFLKLSNARAVKTIKVLKQD